MSQEIKLTQEELDNIKKIQADNNAIIFDLGQIELELRLSEERIESLKEHREKTINRFKSLRDTETELIEQLNKKYGAGQVDLESGVFIPIS